MRVILAFLISLMAAMPASANADGTSPLIVFRNGASRTTEVIATKNSNIVAPDVAFEFVPVNGDKNAGNYTWDANDGLVYSPLPPPAQPPVPDVVGFKLAVLADGNIPQAALYQLLNFVGTLNDAIGIPAALQQAWALVKTQTPSGTALAGNTTDSPPVTVFSKIESYAAQYNIPLVSH